MTFIEIPSWAVSAGGRPILLAHSKSSELSSLDRPIVLVGGVHGDEPEGVILAEAVLKWLKAVAEKKQSLAPWVVIPCLNPDGFTQETRVNANGVDLNRNYPSKNWSAIYDNPRYNPGSSPASEPEVKAMVKLISTVKPRLVIHCHSWNPCIVASGPLARPDAQHLSNSSGYKIVDEIGYPTPGSLSQYGWKDHRIPIICIEEQEKVRFPTIWPRFAAGMEGIFFNTSLR